MTSKVAFVLINQICTVIETFLLGKSVLNTWQLAHASQMKDKQIDIRNRYYRLTYPTLHIWSVFSSTTRKTYVSIKRLKFNHYMDKYQINRRSSWSRMQERSGWYMSQNTVVTLTLFVVCGECRIIFNANWIQNRTTDSVVSQRI